MEPELHQIYEDIETERQRQAEIWGPIQVAQHDWLAFFNQSLGQMAFVSAVDFNARVNELAATCVRCLQRPPQQ
jgi:hypothetical protein